MTYNIEVIHDGNLTWAESGITPRDLGDLVNALSSDDPAKNVLAESGLFSVEQIITITQRA